MLKQTHETYAGWTWLTVLQHDIREKSLNDSQKKNRHMNDVWTGRIVIDWGNIFGFERLAMWLGGQRLAHIFATSRMICSFWKLLASIYKHEFRKKYTKVSNSKSHGFWQSTFGWIKFRNRIHLTPSTFPPETIFCWDGAKTLVAFYRNNAFRSTIFIFLFSLFFYSTHSCQRQKDSRCMLNEHKSSVSTTFCGSTFDMFTNFSLL